MARGATISPESVFAGGRLLIDAGRTESPPGRLESRAPGGDEPRPLGGGMLPDDLVDLRAPGGDDSRCAGCEEDETALSFCCETGRYGSRHSVIASR